MATTTAVEVELSELDGGSRPKTTPLLQGPAQASLGTTGSTLSIHDYEPALKTLPKGRSIVVIIQLAGINFVTSFSNGLIAVGLPTIAADLQLERSLLVWPLAAFALTSGALLLLAGSFADVVGARSVNLVGCFLVALWSLVIGFSQSGSQLIAFRALQGVASALTFPTSVSIITNSITSGQRRNIGLASLGLAMPLGFSVGLVLGGVLITGVGWRSGFYINGGAGFLLFFVGLWSLPAGIKSETQTSVWRRLRSEIDWVGAVVASTSLALFSYVLAALSSNVDHIKDPTNIALLALSLVLAPVFVAWMHRLVKIGKPALIPNAIWRKRAFTSVCLMVLLSTAVMNCMELYSSLFFQEVQELSALQAGIRLLPNMILGIILNFLTGYFVDKIPAIYAILISSGLCAVAPLLMALIQPGWPFWYSAFFAQLLTPISGDILFTVGILVVSEVFPEKTQALAGAVFNTLAQLGTSIGLTVLSVISVNVTDGSIFKDKSSPAALMVGYRAGFWALFAWMITTLLLGIYGLRNLGKVGQKRD